MHYQEFAPPEALQNTIKCFWYDKIDFGKFESAFEVQPDGYAEIIFHFGSGCSISYNGALQPLPSPFLIGLQNQPVHFYSKNHLEIIGIRCFPWTIFDLLQLASSKNGIGTFKHPITQLQSALSECINGGKIDEAVAKVKQYFLDERPEITTDIILSKAGNAMRQANGTMPVSKIAVAAHATVRTLQRKFKQSSGYSVKDVSGLIRFEQVRNHLLLYPNAGLAGLALELGYTDQSHLNREFKRYSGTTPAAFVRKNKERKTSFE